MFGIPQMLYLSCAALAIATVAVVQHRRARRIVASKDEELSTETRKLRHLQGQASRLTRDVETANRYYHVLFNNARDMIFIHGVTDDGLPGKFSQANDVACEKLDLSREKLLTMTPLDIEAVQKSSIVRLYSRTELVTLSDEDLRYRETTSSRQLVTHIMESAEAQYERVFLTRTGRRIPVEIRARRFDHRDKPNVLLIARDITQRKRSERALREGQQRLRALLTHSPVGLALYDADRNLVDVNQSCLRMFGIPDQEEFKRLNLFDNPFIPQEVKERIHRGETARYEADVDFDDVHRDGLFVSARQGHAFFDVLINNLGVDEDFNPKGYLAEAQDITRRRQAEESLRRMERQLRQSQKMEAIGNLAGGIAHDFNNILTPILGYSELLLETTPAEEPPYDFAMEIRKASNRARELVNQILTFSRQSEQSGTRLRITPIVKEVLKFLRASAPSPIEIAYVNKADCDIVLATPTRMHQVLMNLCTNAMHAMQDEGGSLEVRMTNFAIEHRSRSEFPQLEPGRYLRVTVRDTGTGMDRTTVSRIFEPFFTTKVSGEGTGMGLAVAHGIVTGLKGAITCETQLGQGSVFHVVLPTIEGDFREEESDDVAMPRGTEHILFVDDEGDILKLARHMLGSLGYTITTMQDSARALCEFRDDPGRFDLVITDQVMPDLAGDQLCRHMLAVRPELPIILCTGFSETISAPQAEAIGIREFVMKPIVMHHLAQAIRRALD